jgi:hypothetical protein
MVGSSSSAAPHNNVYAIKIVWRQATSNAKYIRGGRYNKTWTQCVPFARKIYTLPSLRAQHAAAKESIKRAGTTW